MRSLFVVFLFAIVASATKADYSGHMLIRVVPETQEQLDHLLSMQRNEVVDFWSAPSFLGKSVDLRVSPESYYHTARRFANINLSHTIRFTDIGKMVEDEMKSILLRRAVFTGAFDWENYHTYPEIVDYVNGLASTNTRVSVTSIGKTYEGRDITMAKVSTGGANKKIMYFECAMHAREWVTPPTCLYLLEKFANRNDAEITDILNYADIWVTPVSNPDGYEYTWTPNNRLWRKNREPNSGSPCVGTDANRNFDASWSGAGASGLPCSDLYYGATAFSSKEASAMRDILVANKGKVVASVSIHSASQYWMSPYGYTTALPQDYTELLRVMKISVEALQQKYNTPYTYGSIANVIYEASGSSVDWAYDNQGILYSYALELRDQGQYGFELPKEQILPTAEETFDGLLAMAKEIVKKAPLKNNLLHRRA